MPTYTRTDTFKRDYSRLSAADKARFRAAVLSFVSDVGGGKGFRKSLRVKGVQGAKGVFEMTWAPDGRATFEYGEELASGQTHIVWRRVGTHDVLNRP